MYVMDYNNDRVQKWFPGASYGVTVAAVNMYNPYGMKLDPVGNVYVADTSYHRIISFNLNCRKFSLFALKEIYRKEIKNESIIPE